MYINTELLAVRGYTLNIYIRRVICLYIPSLLSLLLLRLLKSRGWRGRWSVGIWSRSNKTGLELRLKKDRDHDSDRCDTGSIMREGHDGDADYERVLLRPMQHRSRA